MTRNDAAPGANRGLSAAGGSPTADGSHDNDNLFSSSRDGLPQPASCQQVLAVVLAEIHRPRWLICQCGTLTRADHSSTCPACGSRRLSPATPADLESIRSTALPDVVSVHRRGGQ